MKLLIVFALFIAATMAAPADITVLSAKHSSDDKGYSFDFEQSDGHKRNEVGVLKNVGAESDAITVTGSFSFVAEDGQTYTVTYVADENGTKLIKLISYLDSLINEIFSRFPANRSSFTSWPSRRVKTYRDRFKLHKVVNKVDHRL